MAEVDALAAPDLSFSSYAVQLSYFLTGEHREYDTETAEFDRVSPSSPFAGGAGSGALEFAARLSGMDLDDGVVTGGTLTDITLGVNWYLEQNVRVMFNYVQADIKDVGEAQAIILRFQFDF